MDGDTRNDTPDELTRQRMKAEHRIGWHPQGGWCRKFPGDRNRTYFGRVTPAAAVRAMVKEEDRRERARRGEAVAEARAARLSVREAVNVFLTHLDREYDAGRMSGEQRASYGQELAAFTKAVGGDRPLADVTKLTAPEDIFRPVRDAAVLRGLHAAEKHVTQVRTFLDWCSTVRRYVAAPFYADAFDPPTVKEKRAARKADRRAKGEATWTAAEVREIVEAARQTDVHRYAQVLLMINGGLGASDLSDLDDADVDWERGCIHTDRSKTLVPRVVPLWAATAAAMKASRAARPKPADSGDATRFFLTPHGRPLVVRSIHENRRTAKRTDAVRNWFMAVLKAPPKEGEAQPPKRKHARKIPWLPHLRRHRAGGYTLRSCFTTFAIGQDATLVAVVRGDKIGRGAMEYYLRGSLLDSLRGVVSHVQSQIWPEGGPPLP